jgi:hypothetical protein
MTLMHCMDAAFPPAVAPAHCGAVLGYVGGPKATNVWTGAEWRRFGMLRQYPAYVADLGADPVVQGREAVDLVVDRGWRPGRAIVGDTEAGVNAAWWAAFGGVIARYGFVPVDYGSLSFAAQNKAAWMWAAEWDGLPLLDDGQQVVAVQYAADIAFGGLGTRIDLSVLSAEMVELGGVGPRAGT